MDFLSSFNLTQFIIPDNMLELFIELLIVLLGGYWGTIKVKASRKNIILGNFMEFVVEPAVLHVYKNYVKKVKFKNGTKKKLTIKESEKASKMAVDKIGSMLSGEFSNIKRPKDIMMGLLIETAVSNIKRKMK